MLGFALGFLAVQLAILAPIGAFHLGRESMLLIDRTRVGR